MNVYKRSSGYIRREIEVLSRVCKEDIFETVTRVVNSKGGYQDIECGACLCRTMKPENKRSRQTGDVTLKKLGDKRVVTNLVRDRISYTNNK